MKTKKKKQKKPPGGKKVVIPPPKKRPAPDKTHKDYIAGRKDARQFRKCSWRFCNLLAVNLWITRKEPCEKSDSRYGFYLYSEGFQDAISEKKDRPPQA